MTRLAIITLFTTILLFLSMIVLPLGSNDPESGGIDDQQNDLNDDESRNIQEQDHGSRPDTYPGYTLDPEIEAVNVRAQTGKANLPGTSAFMKGSVNHRTTGSTVWIPSQPEDVLDEGDVLRTGTDSYCQYDFGNKLYMYLSPGSEITCDLSHQMGDSVLMEFTITHGDVAFYCEFGNNGSSFTLFYPNGDKVFVDHSESTIFHSTVDGHIRVFEGFLVYEEKSASPSIENRHLIEAGRDSNWKDVPNTRIEYSYPLSSATISGTGQEIIGFFDGEFTQVGMEEAFIFRMEDSDIFCSWRDDGTPFYLHLGIPEPGVYNVSYLMNTPDPHGFEFTDLRSYSLTEIHFSFLPNMVYVSVGNGFTYNLTITGSTQETFTLYDMNIPKYQGQVFEIIREDKLSSETYGSVKFGLDEDGDGTLDESVYLRSGGDGDDAYHELYRERTEPTYVTMFLMLFLLLFVLGVCLFHGGYLEEMGFIFRSPIPAIMELFDDDDTEDQEIDQESDVSQDVEEASLAEEEEEEEVTVEPIEVADETPEQEEIVAEVEDEEATPESMAEEFVELKKSRVLEEDYDQLDEQGKVKEIEEPVIIVDFLEERGDEAGSPVEDIPEKESEDQSLEHIQGEPEPDHPTGIIEEPVEISIEEEEAVGEKTAEKEEVAPPAEEPDESREEPGGEEASIEDEVISPGEEPDESREEPVSVEAAEEDEVISPGEEPDESREEPVGEEASIEDEVISPGEEPDVETPPIAVESFIDDEDDIKDLEDEPLRHMVEESIGEKEMDPEGPVTIISEPITIPDEEIIGMSEIEPGLLDDDFDEPISEDIKEPPGVPGDLTEDYDLLPDDELKRPDTFPAMFETISKGEPEPIPEESEGNPELQDRSDVVPSQPDSMISEPPEYESEPESAEPGVADVTSMEKGEDETRDTISSDVHIIEETDELLSEPGSEPADEIDDTAEMTGIIKEEFERISEPPPEETKRKKKWYKPHGKWTQANIDLGFIIVGKMREELDFLTLDNTQEERWVENEGRWMTDEEWWNFEVERMKNWDSVIQDSIMSLDHSE